MAMHLVLKGHNPSKNANEMRVLSFWLLPGTLFQIKDNGPGIPESIRDTIFDAFTTSGKPEGTGLGLAIVRRVVEDHGGSVSFTTATGKGTCFTIHLPGPPADAKTTPPEAPGVLINV